jgi:hypothetical protein
MTIETCLFCKKQFVSDMPGTHFCSADCFQHNADQEEEDQMFREAIIHDESMMDARFDGC